MMNRNSCLLLFVSILLLFLGTACTTPDKAGTARSSKAKPTATVPAKKPVAATVAKKAVTAVPAKKPASAPAAKSAVVASAKKAVAPVKEEATSSAEVAATVPPEEKVELVYGDIVMAETAEGMKEGEVEAVVFPHWFNRIRFRCKVCHEDTFKTDKGTNKIDMDSISAGESCGICHDGTVAWDALECESCHFYPLDQVAQDESQKNQEPQSPEDILFAGRTGKVAGRGDRRHPSGSAFKWGSGWQPRALALTGLPKDKYGLVDWVELTRKGTV